MDKALSLCSSLSRNITLLVLTALLLLGSFAISPAYFDAQKADAANACGWYRVHTGDSLGGIARLYHQSITTLARANHMHNANLIFMGQRLCIPHYASGRGSGSGLFSNGGVRWYAYNELEQASRGQITALIRQAAARYRLPASLVMAIAWQESGWHQHVISHDGGIGTMQIMPYTAMGLNRAMGIRYDPYKLWDNINLGAAYLNTLRHIFHGNLWRIISAYNEGAWNVQHRGIFNWHYVHNVLSLMRAFG